MPRGERRYTVAQADQLLPSLRDVLRSLLAEVGGATDPGAVGLLQAVEGHNGGGAAAAAMLEAGQRVEREMAFLRRHGILLRDLEAGLVDFPSEREGVPIFLCWRLGEETVGFWHGRDQGFTQRQPL
ncbi:MAG TPA: DUF2203 domain-containing protein [Candidatus Dormibacteraeota bacterium]